MDTTDLTYLSLHDLAQRLRTHDISPVEVTQTILDRTERLEPVLNAYITLTADSAMEDARRAEQEIMEGKYRGPLHGVPVAMKDWMWMRGVRATMGSNALADLVPGEDAAAVDRLRHAGAVLLGKTMSAELGFGEHLYGLPRNPWDIDRFPGGSSTGSGIALAAGIAYGALGTDTAGSIRWPSAWCGVTGLKPSKGRISLHGVIPFSRNLDHVGPMARSVLDCAHLLDELAGYDARDPLSVVAEVPLEGWAASLGETPRPLRIGVPRTFFWSDLLEEDVRAAAEAALDVFRSLGWTVDDVTLPEMGPILEAASAVHSVETLAVLEPLLTGRHGALSERIHAVFDDFRTVTGNEYRDALATSESFAEALADVFREADILITPTRAGTAKRIGEDGWPAEPLPPEGFRSPFNYPGVPAMSIPCGFDRDDLPAGLQIIGATFRDDLVLAAGHAFQQMTDWHLRRPPLTASATVS